MSTKEAAIRSAANALHDAILAGRKAGLVVAWPATVDGLPAIAISETAKASEDVVLSVVVKGVDPDSPVLAKATQAAQKAADAVTDPVTTK